ncbi:hypothetical protein TNCV_605191 [Trichonephila clavipes]|nr:hypothetical protein TNCV_605191 [Trichonephila clavipes]
MHLHWKLTMTLSAFTATVRGKGDHCDASRRNEFFLTSRLNGRVNVDEISSSHDITGLAIKTSHSTPFASTGLGDRVGVMSSDGARLDREQILHIHRTEIMNHILLLYKRNNLLQVLAASTAHFFQFQRYAATLCQLLIFRVFKSFSTSSIHLVGGLPLVRDPIGFLNV